MKNKFCSKDNLSNESDVEQFFIIKLLSDLGYSEDNIKTKTALKELIISRGSKSENYKPDYVLFADKKPKVVIDAKSPDENIEKFTYQVSGYALSLNKKFKGENPVRFTILTNGVSFHLYKWDEEEPILSMKFEDFVDGNKKFKKLIEQINYENIVKQTGTGDLSIEDFLSKPSVEEIKSAFNKCHNLIWKKEKISPTDAFYEFSKIIFVKNNEDKRIRKIISDGRPLKQSDFYFSVSWLEQREAEETENPLSSILFTQIQEKLNDEIQNNKKKPIFLKEDEGIDLKTQTIKEVVRILQNYDLYTIDEDLNGRMFETFLNATVRGQELGQYFTPRKIVKFMTKLADLKIKRKNGEIVIDKILDACCGSGGFLIDAMADLIEKVKSNPSLKPNQEEILEIIRTQSVFGIEANPKVSRIARMNMYVHGDGGSRIYCADSLDKSVEIHKGTEKRIKKELVELRELLLKENQKFKIVLTNPPFSMQYKSKDKDEKIIMNQYASTDESKNICYENGTTKLKSSVKSNVLFVARYYDLLEDGGKMFIILDNSVLNSFSHKEYRNYIRSNFIIKAVFQLPTHTFVNQEAGGITSLLCLEKRKNDSQEQPPIFARVIEKIGHGTSGKEENDEFGSVLAEYRKYEEDGKLFKHGKHKIGDYEDDELFLINSSKIEDRIDVYFHQPSYNKLIKKLIKSNKDGKCELKRLMDFERIKNIDEQEIDDDGVIYQYMEISAIDKERGLIMDDGLDTGTRGQLPNRAKLLVIENDLLFSKPYRSLPKVAIIPKRLSGQIASSGFYGIRPVNLEEAYLLWGIFRSELIQKQFVHLCSGYTQRELNDDYLSKYLLIPIPTDKYKVSKIISDNIAKAKKARELEIESMENILNEPVKLILN